MFSCESLLKEVIVELKHSILINDVETINNTLGSQKQQLEKSIAQTEEKILQLNNEITEALRELEQEYYSSPFSR